MTSQCCRTCVRGWRRDNGMIGCGAPVDDAALQGWAKGVNPIWAERKYSVARVKALLAGDTAEPEGSDGENMRPDDGDQCKMWELRLDAIEDHKPELAAAEARAREIEAAYPPVVEGYDEDGNEIYAPPAPEVSAARQEVTRLFNIVYGENVERDYVQAHRVLTSRFGEFSMERTFEPQIVQSWGGQSVHVQGPITCKVTARLPSGQVASAEAGTFCDAIEQLLGLA